MRSYGQYCAVAKALDVIGDRWSLLIIRELLTRGDLRYSDLLAGLPGIATNLLADRIDALEAAGVVRRVHPGPPVASRLIRLTDRGEALRPLLESLGSWGASLLGDMGDDRFQTHWLAFPIGEVLRDHRPTDVPQTLVISSPDGEAINVTAANGEVTIGPGASGKAPQAALSASADVLVDVLFGRISLEEATLVGADYRGDRAILKRLQPLADRG